MNGQIRSILIIYSTRPDKYGNKRYGFRYIRCKDGKKFEGMVTSGESNIKTAFTAFWTDKGELNAWRNDYFYTLHEVTNREFNDQLENAKYLSCNPFDIYSEALKSFGDGEIV
jgi:hypothetical protein